MDATRLQRIISLMTECGTRRGLVQGGIAALGLGALGLASDLDETEAHKKSRRKKKSRRQRRRNQNRGGNQGNGGNNQGNGGGGGNNPGGDTNPPGDFRATPCTRVCATGCDFTSVQAAIDATPDGESLVICSGQFIEDITISKNLTLAAVTGGEIVLQGTGTSSVVTIPNIDNFVNVTLRNVAIAGNGTPLGNGRVGGGIFSDNGGSLTLIDCEVALSTADVGGGIYSLNDLIMTDTIINGNQAQRGGGIYAIETVQIEDRLITDNTAAQGGGVYSDAATFTISSGTEIQNNTATSDGGGIYADSGTVTLDASFVQNNTAQSNGGGVFINPSGRVTLQNGAVIENNEAQSGGGVYNLGETSGANGILTVIDSAISHNKADELGGGIFNDDGRVSLQSATVFKNTAGGPGGGIFNTDGGSLALDAESVVVENTPDNCIGSSACPA